MARILTILFAAYTNLTYKEAGFKALKRQNEDVKISEAHSN